jgi:hypothetical protein
VTKLENENLDQGELNRLLKDMKLMPQWINQQQAIDCFRASSFDDAGTVAGADMARLVSFKEFRMLLVQLALTIFSPEGTGGHTSFAKKETDDQKLHGLLSLLHAGALQSNDMKPAADAKVAATAPTPLARAATPVDPHLQRSMSGAEPGIPNRFLVMASSTPKGKAETAVDYIKRITHFKLNGKGILKIENLEQCASMKVLYLHDNRISRIQKYGKGAFVFCVLHFADSS